VSGSILLLERPAATPPKPLLKQHCVDISNYSGPVSQDTLFAWREMHDVGLVIVQAIEPPPNFPAGQTRQQIQACVAAAIPVDAYLFLWTASNVEQDMRTKLALLNGLEHWVRKIWLDVEDTTPASAAQRVSSIRQALAVLDGWALAHARPLPGIYSARWWWTAYIDDTTEFADRQLWTAQYDGIDNTSVFNRFGGWGSCRIKQYAGTSTLAGQGNVDLNVLSDQERADG
jgi:GH25 family lysozyme M1 (1,4-beta-N-acetylmuramidase)